MAFMTRCPECQAKLRFDEQPDADEAIECTRCGHVYDGAEARPIRKKKKQLAGGGGGDDEPPRRKKAEGFTRKSSKAPKKRRARKKKANLFFLYLLIGGVLVFAPIVGWVGYKLFFSAGKVGELMTYIPQSCNLLRGVNVTRLSKYPGYDSQLQAAMAGPFETCRDELAKAAGKDAKTFLDYAVSAKVKDGANSASMLVLMTLEPFDSAALFKGLGGTMETIEGQEVYKLGAKPGVLNNAYIYSPKERHLVLITSEGDSLRMLKGSLAAKATPKETSMLVRRGDLGVKVMRGDIWTLMRPDGDLKNKLKEEISEPLKQSMATLSQRVASARLMGVWLSFGSMVRYGVGIECDDSEQASEFAKSMREGEFGKGEDADIPRDLTAIFFIARNKDFAEFLSTLRFSSSRASAFLEAKMPLEKSMLTLSFFNRPDMWEEKIGAAPQGLRRG